MSNCTASSTSTLDTLNSLASVASAIATLLIAVVAQLYSSAAQKQAQISSMKEELRHANDKIHTKSAVLLLNQHKLSDNDAKTTYVSGASWNDAFDPESSASDTCRLTFLEILDTMRGSAEVFAQASPNGKPNNIWNGPFDVQTMNMKVLCAEFRKFYVSDWDGIKENRQKFVQQQVGTQKSWTTLVHMIKAFDPAFDSKLMPWKLGSVGVSVVSVSPGKDSKDDGPN